MIAGPPGFWPQGKFPCVFLEDPVSHFAPGLETVQLDGNGVFVVDFGPFY